MAARYERPATTYGHWVLGRGRGEWQRLAITYAAHGARRTVSFGARASGGGPSVFEGPAPLLADVTGDGRPEVVATETDPALGARLAVYGVDSAGRGIVARIAATPPIGTPFRWLAVAGAADLDGDGRVEVAYVDRPHLARTLRLWRYADGDFREVASLPGVTNHRIGEPDIAGGLRDCGEGPEILVASADWSAMLAVRFDGSALTAREIGRDTSRPAFARALRCG